MTRLRTPASAFPLPRSKIHNQLQENREFVSNLCPHQHHSTETKIKLQETRSRIISIIAFFGCSEESRLFISLFVFFPHGRLVTVLCVLIVFAGFFGSIHVCLVFYPPTVLPPPILFFNSRFGWRTYFLPSIFLGLASSTPPPPTSPRVPPAKNQRKRKKTEIVDDNRAPRWLISSSILAYCLFLWMVGCVRATRHWFISAREFKSKRLDKT